MRKINHKINIWNILIIISILSFLIIKSGQPTIQFKYGVLKTENLSGGYKFKTGGLYHPVTNTIIINVKSSGNEAIYLIYHEYGHYIYNLISKKDRNKWKNDFCEKKERIGYYRFQICSEEFSDGFADYLLNKMDTIEKWEYFENITSNYLT